MEKFELVEISTNFMENMKYKANANIILVHNADPKTEQDHITNLERIHVFNTKNKVYKYIELFKLEYSFLKKVFSEEKIERIMKSYTLNDLL